jgi:hypothetical protein
VEIAFPVGRLSSDKQTKTSAEAAALSQDGQQMLTTNLCPGSVSFPYPPVQ